MARENVSNLKFFIVRNETLEASAAHFDLKKLIAQQDGVYTVFRTLKQTNIFDLDIHAERIASISRVEPTCSKWASLFTLKFSRELILRSLRKGLLEARKSASLNDEFRITAILAHHYDDLGSWSTALSGNFLFKIDEDMSTFWQFYTFWVVLTPLPPPPSPPVLVDLFILTRLDQNIKRTRWVAETRRIEKKKTEGSEEILICDPQGFITEGISSNFIVIHKSGILETAPDYSILKGATRQRVLRVAQNIGIPIQFQFPQISQREDWLAAAILSCSRGITWVHTIIMQEEHTRHVFSETMPQEAEKLQKFYLKDLEESAIQVLET